MHRTRRNFLIGLPLLAAGVVGYQLRHKFEGFVPENHALEKILSFLKYPSHAAIIGEVYLDQYPQESDSEKLMSKLSDYLSLDLSLSSERDIEKALLRTIKEDYTKDQTVILDGWLLSRTECVLAGLVAVSRLN